MKNVLDVVSSRTQWSSVMAALWRAMAYCFFPRVIFLSFLPLLLAVGLLGGLAWWGWGDAIAAIQRALNDWSLTQSFLAWMDTIGASAFRAALAPVLLIMLAVPTVVVVCLLLVAGFMAPAIVNLVLNRRFSSMESRHKVGPLGSAAWSLGTTGLACLAMLVSLPLWFVPPLVLVVPPLIWGWLTYRVLSFDVLAGLATPDERKTLLRRHRVPLLTMGVITGLLGAAPSSLWAILGVFSVAVAPLLLVASVWIYTLVFAFSCLWFAHYLLCELQWLRAVPAPNLPVRDGVTQVPSSTSTTLMP